jgi:hypothetical protein
MNTLKNILIIIYALTAFIVVALTAGLGVLWVSLSWIFQSPHAYALSMVFIGGFSCGLLVDCYHYCKGR